MSKNMANRKELILVAAVRLIRAQGWSKTTVADIAREANVGTGTVYLEFRSKDSIIHELSMQRYGKALRAMRRATMKHGGWGERFRQMMNERTNLFIEMMRHESNACELLDCQSDSVRLARDHFASAQKELLVDFLAAAREEDALQTSSPPERAARALLLAYEQFTPPHLPQNVPDAEILQALEDLHEITVRGVFKES